MRFVLCAFLLLWPALAAAELRGHGGPVRAVAVSPDGRLAMSGSFDQSAILWALNEGAALRVIRFHEGAVNAVAALPDGRFLTGGEDGRVAVWRSGAPTPERTLEGHEGPVAGLAVSPDGRFAASASWDGTARVAPLDGGAARVLRGHAGQVNAAAFLPDGRVATAGYDGTLRIWPTVNGSPEVRTLPTPLNTVAAAPDGEVAVAGADGAVRVLAPDGTVRLEIEAGQAPIIALALSPDCARIAVATIGGSVTLIDRRSGDKLFSLVGPGLPVWSLAFRPDGTELVTGGGDRLLRRWDMRTGEPIGPVILSRPGDALAAFAGDRGAEVFRACVACHTLSPDGGNRAGPTLHGLFGRRIASLPDYPFSDALKRMAVVWTPETVSELFAVGPSRYTPGTRMPEQVIIDPDDRVALMRFLERATR